jgi:hypothetical protein
VKGQFKRLAGAGTVNQQVANAVANELKASGNLQRYRVDVRCQAGVVELSGFVATGAQARAAIQLAQRVPGVQRVVSRLRVMEESVVTTAQFDPQEPEPVTPPPMPMEDKEPLPAPRVVAPEAGAPLLAPAPGAVQPDPNINDPIPSFRAPMPPPNASTLPPPMPPYAWPSFAPYNNFSRVAYPVAYPNEAFPCIGPLYPFPKTPLSWRSASLQWDDGHWWLMTHGQKRDWWTLRYW